MKTKILLSLLILSFTVSAYAENKVFFTDLKENAEVTSPFKVSFGLEGMKIGPVGDMTANTGHHHLIVDGQPVAAGQPVPFDASHLHFGKGQTETELKLPPGTHTLTLQFANGAHLSYGPEMSKTIKIKVK